MYRELAWEILPSVSDGIQGSTEYGKLSRRAHSPRIAEWRERSDSAYAGSRRWGSVTLRANATNRFCGDALEIRCQRLANKDLPSRVQCFVAVSTARCQRALVKPFLEPPHSRPRGNQLRHPSPSRHHLGR